jgi:hypothetical protein
MHHGKTRGVGDGLLLIGLTVGVMSLVTVVTRPAEHPASISSLRTTPVANPVAPAPSTTSRDRLGNLGARGTVSPDHLDRHDRGWQGDARLDLRDAAAMARWYLWARPGRGETRTDLWINAPTSIGSTSPPEASPASASPRSDDRFR